MNVIEFIRIDPFTITSDEWKKFHVFRKIRHLETNFEDPLSSDEAIETNLVQDFENTEYHVEYYYIYYENDKSRILGTVATFIFSERSPSYKGNEHLLHFEFSLLPEVRRNGIGTQILGKVIEIANKLGKKLLITSTKEESGKKFLKNFKFTTALSNKENRLKLKDVDWDLVDRWIKEGQNNNPETKKIFFDNIPDDFIDQFAKILTETMNQAPLGSLDIAELVQTPEVLRKREADFAGVGRTQTTVVTIESDGKISALSEMFYSRDTKKILGQNFTGVQEDYRGRGLGKWVKAALLQYMYKKYPEAASVKTGNAESNAPMLSINNRLGFKVYRESILAQIKVEDLLANQEKRSRFETMVSV